MLPNVPDIPTEEDDESEVGQSGLLIVPTYGDDIEEVNVEGIDEESETGNG